MDTSLELNAKRYTVMAFKYQEFLPKRGRTIKVSSKLAAWGIVQLHQYDPSVDHVVVCIGGTTVYEWFRYAGMTFSKK